ncbi:MAG: hypothetical protein AB7N76_08715 [Planctomycetota bacterium]
MLEVMRTLVMAGVVAGVLGLVVAHARGEDRLGNREIEAGKAEVARSLGAGDYRGAAERHALGFKAADHDLLRALAKAGGGAYIDAPE